LRAGIETEIFTAKRLCIESVRVWFLRLLGSSITSCYMGGLLLCGRAAVELRNWRRAASEECFDSRDEHHIMVHVHLFVEDEEVHHGCRAASALSPVEPCCKHYCLLHGNGLPRFTVATSAEVQTAAAPAGEVLVCQLAIMLVHFLMSVPACMRKQQGYGRMQTCCGL
jgi:hypothetical protein